jgi:exopolysaccharide biosynthesis polyprenyl glycosylphosphotransferase
VAGTLSDALFIHLENLSGAIVMSNLADQIKERNGNAATLDLRDSKWLTFSRSLITQNIRASYLIALDSILLILARYITESLSSTWNPTWSFKENPSIIILLVGINISIFLTNGLYKSGKNRRNYPAIFKSISTSSLIILLVAFLYFPQALLARSTFLLFWAFSFFFISFGRYISNLIIIKCNKANLFLHSVFLIVDPQNASTVIDLIRGCAYYKFCGWDEIGALSLENIDQTIARLRSIGVSEVYIHANPLADPMYVYWKLQHAGITLYLLPGELKPVFREVELSYIHSIPCFRLNAPSIEGVSFLLKRVFDFLGAAIFLVLLSPIYLILSIIIFLDNPGPIFYRQLRIGLHNQPFNVWKFRTMVANADQLQKTLEDQNVNKDGILFKIRFDPRVTRIGKILRRYSLDELPQVFNVLLGEMSFIGPRPLPLRDVEKFDAHHHIRHEVLPGITGLWQISGRSDIQNFDDVLKLDIQYIEQWSIWLDLKILLKTILVVITRSGAY